MPKVTALETISNIGGNPTSAETALNENFESITEAFENTLSRDGSTPNEMEADLDMNSNRIINMLDGVNPQDGVTVSQLEGVFSSGLLDGNKGDITVSSGASDFSINAGVVTTTELGGDITTAGKALLDDADAASQRITLGLGTAALFSSATFAQASHTHDHTEISDILEAFQDFLGQYLIAGTNVTVTYDDTSGQTTVNSSGGGGGVSDHGALTGLADDDHLQYHTDARGDARYSLLGHDHDADYAPLVHVHDHGDLTGLADNDHPQYLLAASYTAADVLAKLLTVDGAGSGLDADLLDGLSSAAFSLASHSHTASEISDFSEAVDDRVAALIVAGTNMTITYNDGANTLTFDATGGSGGGYPEALGYAGIF